MESLQDIGGHSEQEESLLEGMEMAATLGMVRTQFPLSLGLNFMRKNSKGRRLKDVSVLIRWSSLSFREIRAG